MSLRVLLRRVNRFSSVRSASSAVASLQDVLQNRGDECNLTGLDNGFRVASYSNQKNIATVGVWIDSGSRYEHDENNGVASLYEHLLYSGNSKSNAQQLQNSLAKIGAKLNSYTTRDHTAYFAECFAGDVEKVVQIIADVVRNTNYDQGKLEEQKQILLKKIDEQELDHRETVLDNLHKTAFQGTPYSLSPLGSRSVVENLTVKDVQQFVEDHCKGGRMVLAGVGGVDHDQLAGLAQKHFGDLDNSYARKMPDPRAKLGVRFTASEYVYRDDTYPYLYGALAVEGVPRSHQDWLPLQIASQSVGQWDTTHRVAVNSPSRVVQKMSTVHGAQAFENFSFSYDTTGLFGCYFISEAHDVEHVVHLFGVIQRQWKHLATGVTDQELERVKNQLKTTLFQQLESNTALAQHVATEVLTCDNITPLHELERQIQQTTAKSLRAAVYRNIYDRGVAVAGVGLTEAIPEYQAVQHAMSWWRL